MSPQRCAQAPGSAGCSGAALGPRLTIALAAAAFVAITLGWLAFAPRAGVARGPA